MGANKRGKRARRGKTTAKKRSARIEARSSQPEKREEVAFSDVEEAFFQEGLALSVEHGNFAHELYRSEGFTVVASSTDRDTMVRLLR